SRGYLHPIVCKTGTQRGPRRLYYYEPNSSHFAMILGERVDKVDAMDKVDWITCGVWRPRTALHGIYCLIAALPRCATRVSFVGRLGVDQRGFAHAVNVEPGCGCPEA